MATVAELEARVAKLELMLGAKFADKPPTDADLIPANEIPGSGYYPWLLGDFQLRTKAINPFFGANGLLDLIQRRLAALEARPSGDVVTDPVPSSAVTDVVEILRTFDIHVRHGKLGVGIEPDDDNPAALHIGGRSIASINGISNIAGTDTQNPGERHSNIFCVCDNDGGMRGVQYGHWFNGQLIRNTTNRRMSIFALFDSMGDTCINDDVGGHGQDFYIVRDTANKRVILGGYKPGWTIEVRETSVGAPYSAMDVKKL